MSTVHLKLGDIIRNSGTHYIIDRITDSGARGTPLNRKLRTVHDKLNDKVKTFEETGKPQRFSVLTEEEYILEHRGRQGLADFQAGRKAANRSGSNNGAADNRENGMSKKAGNKKAADDGAPHSKGKLGELMGFSVVSVLRRLGVENVTVGHARAIMEKQGIKVNPATVQIQIGHGRNGKGEPAALTKAQVSELKNSAEEPKAEPKAPKANKGGGKKGGKGGSKPKAKAKAEDAPAGPSATQAVYGVESVASTKP